MVRNKQGYMVIDPFAAQKKQRSMGRVNPMGESKKIVKEQQTLVKNLRRLLETEVSQAEIMMAAKGFAQEFQEMIEKVGRLQNEDLPPVTDQMRETYGGDSASAFQTQIYSVLQSVMDSLYTAKNQVDDAVTNMAQTGQVSAQVDMDKDLGGMDDGMGDEMGDDMAADPDLDNIAGDLDDEGMDDEFGGAEEEEPLGRSMKTESIREAARGFNSTRSPNLRQQTDRIVAMVNEILENGGDYKMAILSVANDIGMSAQHVEATYRSAKQNRKSASALPRIDHSLEEAATLQRKVMEMRKLVEKARKLKEARN
jgi:uncharacterized protein YukE